MILENKVVDSADMFHRIPLDKWADEYTSKVDDMPQWYPHLFGGMPSYGGFIYAPSDPFRKVFDYLKLNWGIRYWFHFIIASMGMFYYLKWKKFRDISSIFGSISFSISPYLFGLINAGHPAKLYAIAFIPFSVLFAEKIIYNRSYKAMLGLTVLLALQLWTKHVQIVYYTWMLILFIWFWHEGKLAIEKKFKLKFFVNRTILLAVSIIFSCLLVSDPYLPIYEFHGHSTRGTNSSLEENTNLKKGASWEYATQWSLHPKETISFLYPYFYGLQNFPTRNVKSQAYWGYMPFTQSTHYMGLVVIVLGIIGFLIKYNNSKRISMGVASFIILLIGFGHYFPLFYWPLYKFAPLFSSFRIPSMIYILLPFTFSILAANCLNDLINYMDTNKFNIVQKPIIYVLLSLTGLSLFLLLFGPDILSFSKLGEMSKYQPSIIDQLSNQRKEVFQKGALLAFFLSSGMLASIWLAFKKIITTRLIGFIIIGLTLFDLWIVNNEFINPKSERILRSGYKVTEEVKFLNENKGNYRIIPLEQFNSNRYAYFGLSSVGGYRPVKLRSYQDLIDSQAFIYSGIQDMLNVKYLITNRNLSKNRYKLVFNGKTKIYENLSVLPKAWFVESTLSVNSMHNSIREIINADFDPKEVAVVLNYKSKEKLSIGSVELIEYSENKIILQSQSDGPGFLVLSENYYGPGWNATIDNVETKIFRTNHVLRGINVPSGNHTIVFSFNDSTYNFAKSLSFFSILFIISIGLILYFDKIKIAKNSFIRKK
tara:strand:+ start:10352 stop:12649 length:2298 start_codon:yes stop_codon:yes gene_type:complete